MQEVSILLAEQFDVFFLDLDGVIYIGPKALPNVIPSLQRLRAQGKHIRFITNNPCSTREQIATRLRDLGVQAEKEEVITASWATCLYLCQQGIRRIYSIGSPDILSEFAEVGVSIDEENPEAVVVGCEDLTTYTHLLQATRFIRKGARFIATMIDAWFPTPDGPSPAAGSIVAALQTSSERHAMVIGKPAPTMFLEARRGLEHIDPARIVMIGDTPASDILGAHQAGLSAILISRKAPGTQLFPGTRDFRQPDALIPDLSALFDEQYTIRNWEPAAYVWPQRTVPGVAAVILNDQGNVLVRRSDEKSAWELPMGSVEPGETVEEALKRLVLEETGLNVHIKRLSGIYSEPASRVLTHPSGEIIHAVTTCFLCEIIEAEDVKVGTVEFVKAQLLPGVQRQWVDDAQAPTERAFIR